LAKYYYEVLDKFFIGHPDNRLYKKMITQKIKTSKKRLNFVLYGYSYSRQKRLKAL